MHEPEVEIGNSCWNVILVTHIAYRRALGPERIAQLPMRLRFFCIDMAGHRGSARDRL